MKRLENAKTGASTEGVGVIPLPSDLDDLSELGQAVVREMEAKYGQERDHLIKVRRKIILLSLITLYLKM